MPVAVVGFLATQGAAYLGASAFLAGAIGVAASGVVGNAIARREAARAQRDAANAYNASLQDRTTVIRSPVVARNIVLGQDRTSGPLACWFTWGDKRQYHTFAVVLAGHECDSIVSHWFNADQLTLDADGWVTAPEKYVRVDSPAASETLTFDGSGNAYLSQIPNGRVTVIVPLDEGGNLEQLASTTSGSRLVTCAFAASRSCQVHYTYTTRRYLFRIRSYLGASGQSAAQELIDAAAASGNPAAWDSSRRGSEVCYSTIQMEADYNTLGQIGVPNYSAVVKGVKAYDQRTGLTAWTSNSAVLTRWFLVQSRYSPATTSAEIGGPELEASADVCDESVAFSASRTEARYTCNGQIRCDATPLENLRHILDSMDGDAVWVGGAWQIVAGYYRTPTLTITEATLSESSIKINPATPKDQLFNLVQGTYSGPATGYQASRYQAINPSDYVTEDNGEVLPTEMNFQLVNDDVRCQMIAWQRLTRSRQQLTVTLGTNLKGYDAWPLENVNITAAEFGWTSKVFAVRRREFNAPRLTYSMQETSAAVWNWNYANASAAVTIPNTSLPDASTIPTVVLNDPESGTEHLIQTQDGAIISRIYVSWGAIRYAYVLDGGWVQVQYKRYGESDWQSAPLVPGDETSTLISDVVDGEIYFLRARAITNGGRRGPWSEVQSHTVVGKTAPPDDVTGFQLNGDVLTWTPLDAADLAGYLIRFQYGSNTAWGDAVPMHEGIVTSSPYEIRVRPSGAVTLLIKAIDRSGNESANPARIITNLGDPAVANVVETHDFDALDYPGSITGAALAPFGSPITNRLEANSLTAFYSGNDSAPMYTDDESTPMYGGTFDSLVWTSDEWSPSEAAEGSVMTLSFVAAGQSIKVEYRRTGPSAMYSGDDSRPMYSVDDTTAMYESPPDFEPWPGSVMASNEPYQWRVTISGGLIQGTLDSFIVTVDVPDKEVTLNDVAIGSGGSRLTGAAGIFGTITNVQLTVQGGGSAITAEYQDKTNTTSGPLVYCRDASGVAVDGTVSARVKGYGDF